MKLHSIVLTAAAIVMAEFCAANIYDDYVTCKNSGDFIRQNLVCDVDNLFSTETEQRLQRTLAAVQRRISCKCADRNLCYRHQGSGSTGFTASLIATTSAKTDGLDMADTARRIYLDSGLGREDCANGMLVIYEQDRGTLSTYRGASTYHVLTEEEMNRLEDRAKKDGKNEDDALQYLFRAEEYQGKQSDPKSWAAIIGLFFAILVGLFALLLLLGLLISYLCKCCCFRKKEEKKRQKRISDINGAPYGSYKQNSGKESFSHSSTYKKQNGSHPIYVVSEASDLNSTGQEIIYSTPASGTPNPGRVNKVPSQRSQRSDETQTIVRSEFRPGDLKKELMQGDLRPEYGTVSGRIEEHYLPGHEQQGSLPKKKNKKMKDQSDSGDSKRGDSPAQSAGGYAGSGHYQDFRQLGRPVYQEEQQQQQLQENTNRLPFLDPRRDTEVQTKNDFIY